jgi:protein gp37
MSANTGIAWTDHTFNPWWGCQRVSPGCEHCYAETFDHRLGGKHWGPQAERRFFGDAHWNEPRKWNKAAREAGVRKRVFCASMADVFEARDDLNGERLRLWQLIEETPWLDWQLLTKRPENVAKILTARWLENPRPNVWIGTTVEDQKRADERVPELLKVPAAVRFLSVEPLLERVSFRWARWVPLGKDHVTRHLDGLRGIRLDHPRRRERAWRAAVRPGVARGPRRAGRCGEGRGVRQAARRRPRQARRSGLVARAAAGAAVPRGASMSARLLDLESERRVLEQEQELEELRRARTIRAELTLPVPQPPVALVSFGALKAETEARFEAAETLLRWWRERPQGQVTSAQIARLARRIRGVGRGRE